MYCQSVTFLKPLFKTKILPELFIWPKKKKNQKLFCKPSLVKYPSNELCWMKCLQYNQRHHMWGNSHLIVLWCAAGGWANLCLSMSRPQSTEHSANRTEAGSENPTPLEVYCADMTLEFLLTCSHLSSGITAGWVGGTPHPAPCTPPRNDPFLGISLLTRLECYSTNFPHYSARDNSCLMSKAF